MNWLKNCLIRLVTTKMPDPVFNEMNHIVLRTELDRDAKMRVLSAVHDQVKQMIMHFDTLRHQNLRLALIVFTGLLGVQVKFGQALHYWPVGVATIVIMSVFFLVDFKYHVYSHGYQATLYTVIHKMAQIDFYGDIEFDQYDFSYAATAELRSLSAIIYYGLLIAAGLTWAIQQFGWARLLVPPSTS
jgi:hypothetical protein